MENRNLVRQAIVGAMGNMLLGSYKHAGRRTFPNVRGRSTAVGINKSKKYAFKYAKSKGKPKTEKTRGVYYSKAGKIRPKQRKLIKLANAIERVNCERNMYPFTAVSQLTTSGSTNVQCYDVNHQVANYNDISSIFSQCGADKFLIERCYFELQFANQGNAQVVMDVYECLTRKDTPSARSQPEYLTDGIGDAGGSAITVVGMSPYDSPSWCQYFKILNKSRYILQAGETGVIKKNYRLNKQIQVEEWQPQGSQVIWGQGKLTRIWLLIARGQVCNDSVNTSNVGTTPVKIDLMSLKKYFFTWTQDKSFTNVTMSGSLGAIANHAEFIGGETDAVITGESYA